MTAPVPEALDTRTYQEAYAPESGADQTGNPGGQLYTPASGVPEFEER